MDKPPSSAPPRHRRYPRAAAAPRPPAVVHAAPAGAAVPERSARRWPRAIPERRVFPRG